MKNITVYTNFCEDVRQEASGQISLIGVFASGYLISEEFPVLIEKLCLNIEISIPLKIIKGNHNYILSVKKDEDEIWSYPISVSKGEPIFDPDLGLNDKDKVLSARVCHTFFGLKFDDKGVIAVRLSTENGTIIKGGLLGIISRKEIRKYLA